MAQRLGPDVGAQGRGRRDRHVVEAKLQPASVVAGRPALDGRAATAPASCGGTLDEPVERPDLEHRARASGLPQHGEGHAPGGRGDAECAVARVADERLGQLPARGDSLRSVAK